jgi:hypothetical protein
MFVPPCVLDFEDGTSKAPPSNIRLIRTPEKLRRIVLHQNGFTWKQDNPKRFKIRAHAQFWGSGRVTQNYDPLARLRVSSNNANGSCVALEFSGNFEGDPGRGNFYKPEKFGRAYLTDEAIDAGLRYIRDLVSAFPSINEINAHRQWGVNKKGKPNRPLCCGWEIWHKIAVPAMEMFGFSCNDGKAYKGLDIPESWMTGVAT